ncbi:unnamed protein product [Protopolystoma xenopodis]|uniref:Uncharacterized protein n=1 Tax=Protopolystoma xenopodis TaxID=117903 RepID=A0A3S4ZXK5_9PLAT|nr:unnamed protein product [Protopolystoma xenopodis]
MIRFWLALHPEFQDLFKAFRRRLEYQQAEDSSSGEEINQPVPSSVEETIKPEPGIMGTRFNDDQSQDWFHEFQQRYSRYKGFQGSVSE